MIYCNIIRVGKGRHPKKNCIKSEIGIIYLTPLPLLKEWKTKHHLNQNKKKLSLIKQIFNVDKYILAISPSKLIIIGFYEVMKCYSETPPLPCFSSFVNDENSIIFQTPPHPHPHNIAFFTLLTFFLGCFPLIVS